MGLNYIREAAFLVYLRHVYNNIVEETFFWDELIGEDITIPIEDRFDNAVKRVQKLLAAFNLSARQTCRGGSSADKRGGSGRRGDIKSIGGDNSTEGNGTIITTIGPSPHIILVDIMVVPRAILGEMGAAAIRTLAHVSCMDLHGI